MNIKIRINQLPAAYYRSNDIPNMPDCKGIWIVEPERFEFIKAIMQQDLARWMEFREDSYPDEIAAWKRQLAQFEKAVEINQAISEPAERANQQAQEAKMADWFMNEGNS